MRSSRLMITCILLFLFAPGLRAEIPWTEMTEQPRYLYLNDPEQIKGMKTVTYYCYYRELDVSTPVLFSVLGNEIGRTNGAAIVTPENKEKYLKYWMNSKCSPPSLSEVPVVIFEDRTTGKCLKFSVADNSSLNSILSIIIQNLRNPTGMQKESLKYEIKASIDRNAKKFDFAGFYERNRQTIFQLVDWCVETYYAKAADS